MTNITPINRKNQTAIFSLQSFSDLLNSTCQEIKKANINLDSIESYMLSDEVLAETKGETLANIHRAITNRQRVNVSLFTQILLIANKNEQIKLLLDNLIKPEEEGKSKVKRLTPKTRALLSVAKEVIHEL